MEWCGADKVLRKEGYLYFLDEIEELEENDEVQEVYTNAE